MEMRGLLEVIARRGWFVLACAAGVWVAVALQAPVGGAPVGIAMDGNEFVPPVVRAHLRAERLREEHHIAVLDVPADTAPLPAAALVAPVVYRIHTAHPVIFITIDDGVYRQPDAAQYLIRHQLPVTAFLTVSSVQADYGYFRLLQRHGTSIQNHTFHHPHMPSQTVERQRAEVCSTSDILTQEFGIRPTLFRPPYGEYDLHTQEMAAACGIRAVVWWSVVVNGGHLHYQPPAAQLMAGDIVLLHFRPELRQDLEMLTAAAHARGLAIGRLEDYLR